MVEASIEVEKASMRVGDVSMTPIDASNVDLSAAASTECLH